MKFIASICIIISIVNTKAQVVPTQYVITTSNHFSVNGSDTYGMCSVTAELPITCRDPTSSVIFDRHVPTLTGLRGHTWASEILILQATSSTSEIEFSFTATPGYAGVERVEVVMFNCPQWEIGIQTLRVLASLPSGSREQVGTINPSLTSCDSLITVCLPTRSTSRILTLQFFLPPDANWVHLAEVTFYGSGNICPLEGTTTTPSPPLTTVMSPPTTVPPPFTTAMPPLTTAMPPPTTAPPPPTTVPTTKVSLPTTVPLPPTTAPPPLTTVPTTEVSLPTTMASPLTTPTLPPTTAPPTTSRSLPTTVAPTTEVSSPTPETTARETTSQEDMDSTMPPFTSAPCECEACPSCSTFSSNTAPRTESNPATSMESDPCKMCPSCPTPDTDTSGTESDRTTPSFTLTQCEVCPSCSHDILLSSVITAIITALLTSLVFLLVIVACKCRPHAKHGVADLPEATSGIVQNNPIYFEHGQRS